MKSLKILPEQQETECRTESVLSDGLLSLQLNLPMACGGQGLCATCHVHVVEGAENLSPISNREERTLNMLTNRSASSRLSCQACVHGDVQVMIPQADYIQNADDLVPMIGKRASRDVLHAKDGRVLVKRGQIISRYVIKKLKESFD